MKRTRGVKALLLAASLCACGSGNGQLATDACRDSLIATHNQRQDFYENADTTRLVAALQKLNRLEPVCEDYKGAFVMQKIMLYLLLKRYAEGSTYINTLDSSNFEKPYQKQMYALMFQTQHALLHKDSTKARQLVAVARQPIEVYIRQFPNDSVAVCELYGTLALVMRSQQLLEHFESNKARYHFSPDFLEGIRGSLTTVESHGATVERIQP